MAKSKLTNYPNHPYTQMFPVMTGLPFDSLVEDIRQHKQQVPCQRYKGFIIDGRNRILACQKLGITPIIVEWRPPDPKRNIDTQILEFIVAMNIHRRQLSESQRAMIAADYYNKIKGKTDTQIGNGRLSAKAAAMFEVGLSCFHRALRIVNWGDKELAKLVRTGEATTWAAYTQILYLRTKRLPNQKDIDRNRLLRQFRHMVDLYRKNHPEFNPVWTAMRKALDCHVPKR